MTHTYTFTSVAVPVLFLDLDGTVRHGKDELGHFVNHPNDVVIFPEALMQMRRWKAQGGRIVAVTNQGGVALGHMTKEIANQIQGRTHRLTEGLFDHMEMCIHHPDAPDRGMAQCWCRKPRAGMVIEGAMRLFDQHQGEYYPPHLALMVGDRAEDRECAYNAHVAFMWAQDWRREARRLNENLCCEHAPEDHVEGYLKVGDLRQATVVCSKCDCRREL